MESNVFRGQDFLQVKHKIGHLAEPCGRVAGCQILLSFEYFLN